MTPPFFSCASRDREKGTRRMNTQQILAILSFITTAAHSTQ